MRVRTWMVLGATVVSSFPGPATAQSDDSLLVGVRRAPPFAMMENGEWEGIAVELWRRIAGDLGRPYRLTEYGLDSLLDAVSNGTVDVALGALTMTAERERSMDFTHPFHIAGLGITIRTQRAGIIGTALDGLFSLTFLRVVGGLVLLLVFAGLLVWLFERRRNPDQFGSGVRGVGEGFWWAAVTMTTVGYGDKAPRTTGGRLVAFLWMFASIIMISGFTAGIATALTVSGLESDIDGLEDLPRVATATVSGSPSETVLLTRGVRARPFDELLQSLDALAAGEVDAVVYDKPLLQYYAIVRYDRQLRVLPQTFARQDYALAVTDGGPLREPINQSLLQVVASRGWSEVIQRYLGTDSQ